MPELFLSVSRRRREERGQMFEAGLQHGILHVVFLKTAHRAMQNAAPRNPNETQQTSHCRFAAEQEEPATTITAVSRM